jgi:hypothetical protein
MHGAPLSLSISDYEYFEFCYDKFIVSFFFTNVRPTGAAAQEDTSVSIVEKL